MKVVGEQAGVPVFTLGTEKPEIIAQKALAYAKDHGNDIVILDTAGRLQIDDQLMDELVRIKQAVEVDETLLVVDAMAVRKPSTWPRPLMKRSASAASS